MRSYRQYCAVARALDVVGDRWTLLIARELLLQGPCRYTDLARGLPGIATNLLAERLRELEAAGLLRRTSAPPPAPAALLELTDAGRELEPVLDALGQFGIRYMTDPIGDAEFRSHWLTFPVTRFLADREPDGPPLSIEVRTGDRPAVIEAAGGAVRIVPGPAEAPDLVLDGPPPLVLGLFSGRLTVNDAEALGLEVTGDAGVLDRLLPSAAVGDA